MSDLGNKKLQYRNAKEIVFLSSSVNCVIITEFPHRRALTSLFLAM